MLTVGWPSQAATRAQVWRVLDLSGMTKSVRESRNYTRSGYLYLNGSRITDLRREVGIGEMFTLELRFPNGVVDSQDIMLVNTPRTAADRSRGNVPFYTRYRG